MCRNKGYTPEKQEHDARWQLDKETGNYFKADYMQVAATSGLPIIMKDTVTQQQCFHECSLGACALVF